jgi:hypothetical protein
MKNLHRIFILLLIFVVFIFIGNANALKFTGNAWMAQPDGTDEYYLLIENSGMVYNKVKLKGFKFESPASAVSPDFSELTENESPIWFDIDEQNSRKIKKFNRKAAEKSQRRIRKGKLDRADQEAWEEEWVDSKLASHLYKLVLRDGDWNKYKAKISLEILESPTEPPGNEVHPPAPGNDVHAVPEPAIMLFLGSGLLCLAGISRKKFFKM